VALENQRYGRNKSTLVNKTYIESGEYRRKFDSATDNPDVNKALYNCAKKALLHRSGTVFEDMYWIDGNTGEIILSVTESTDERAIVYTDKIRNAIKNNENIITLHTHPSSMPPSGSDLNSNFTNGYTKGFVACHNGKVFGYTSNEPFSEELNTMYIQRFINGGFEEFEAQLKALEKLSETFDVNVWEVGYNG
jgi:proteasome lid subunit RPN8/RPN11